MYFISSHALKIQPIRGLEGRFIYRGYYMAVRRYGFYLQVLIISLTSEQSERVRDIFNKWNSRFEQALWLAELKLGWVLSFLSLAQISWEAYMFFKARILLYSPVFIQLWSCNQKIYFMHKISQLTTILCLVKCGINWS